MYLALAPFLATYVLLLIFGKYRAYIVAASALFVVLGILPWAEVPAAIDWKRSADDCGHHGRCGAVYRITHARADGGYHYGKSAQHQMGGGGAFPVCRLISAFVDNVAIVLMVAPVGWRYNQKLDISPVPVIIAIAVSSNLRGAATLVGDTTSILLGGYADMNFLDFFVFRGRPGFLGGSTDWVPWHPRACCCITSGNLRQPVRNPASAHR